MATTHGQSKRAKSRLTLFRTGAVWTQSSPRASICPFGRFVPWIHEGKKNAPGAARCRRRRHRRWPARPRPRPRSPSCRSRGPSLAEFSSIRSVWMYSEEATSVQMYSDECILYTCIRHLNFIITFRDGGDRRSIKLVLESRMPLSKLKRHRS